VTDSSVRATVLAAAFAALIIVGAIFSFPAPWNPVVPFTLATLFVILAGLILGPWLGLAAVGLYWFMGAVGLPVFAGGSGGIQVFAGPTGGFLVGYGLAALVAGLAARMGRGRLATLIIGAVLGTLVIYLPGLPWMHRQLTGAYPDWTWTTTLGKGALPFLIGDGVKAAAAVLVARVLGDRVWPSSR